METEYKPLETSPLPNGYSWKSKVSHEVEGVMIILQLRRKKKYVFTELIAETKFPLIKIEGTQSSNHSLYETFENLSSIAEAKQMLVKFAH